MADNIQVRDALGASITMRTSDSGGIHTPIHNIGGYDEVGDKILVGTAKDRFYTSFFDFDTTDDFEVVSTGSGMAINGPLGGAVAGTTPYLEITSGVTANAQTVIMGRGIYRMPMEIRMGVTASQRIANQSLRIGFLECDPVTGALVTSTKFATAPSILNARNGAMFEFSGTSVNNGNLLIRTAASALETTAIAFGTGFTTLATGTSPNFILADSVLMSMERDRVYCRYLDGNALTNGGVHFARELSLPNPTKTYRLAIIVENGSVAPASTTSWRLHFLNILDNTRFDIGPRYGGQTDLSRAMPVNVLSSPSLSVTNTNLSNIFYNESTTAQAAGATVTGTARDTAAALTSGVSAAHRYSAFNAFAFADQAGTMRIECSQDNVTWRPMTTSVAVAANTPVILSVPVMARYHRVLYTNGATLQTAFMLNTSYTAA